MDGWIGELKWGKVCGCSLWCVHVLWRESTSLFPTYAGCMYLRVLTNYFVDGVGAGGGLIHKWKPENTHIYLWDRTSPIV